MAEASSTQTERTRMPSGGVCGVFSCMPRICFAAASAPAGSSASLMPPPLPRPPACTCAFTTTRPPSRWAISRALAGRVGDVTVGDRHAELAQQRLGLVLVDFHWSECRLLG